MTGVLQSIPSYPERHSTLRDTLNSPTPLIPRRPVDSVCPGLIRNQLSMRGSPRTAEVPLPSSPNITQKHKCTLSSMYSSRAKSPYTCVALFITGKWYKHVILCVRVTIEELIQPHLLILLRVLSSVGLGVMYAIHWISRGVCMED